MTRPRKTSAGRIKPCPAAPALTVAADGSFTLAWGSLSLAGCCPAIDGAPVRPLAVRVSRSSRATQITYRLKDALLKLEISRAAGGLDIASRLTGVTRPIQWCSPLASSELTGLRGLFRQGFEVNGPSGHVSRDALAREKDALQSFGVVALQGDGGFLFLYADEHARYVNRYALELPRSAPGYLRIANHPADRINAGFRLEGCGRDTIDLPVLRLRTGIDLAAGLEQVATHTAVTMKARGTRRPLYHYDPWYYWEEHQNYANLCECLDGFRVLERPFQYAMVEMHPTFIGDWLEARSDWTGGLAAACERIKEAGIAPGIWIGPYMVGSRSRLFREHPEWMLRRRDGTLHVEWERRGKPPIFGYSDEEFYSLDTSHPGAFAFLRQVFREFRRMGILYYKLDFLNWGIVDSSEVARHRPGKTSVQYQRDLLAMVREETGDEAFLLTCLSAFHPVIGYADGQRVAWDTGPGWESSTDFMIRESVADNYLQHRYWQNDPDVLIIRDFESRLNDREVVSLVLFQALCGGVVSSSDPLHRCRRDRVALFNFVAPIDKPVKPRIPFLSQERGDVVLVHDAPGSGYLVFVLNSTREPLSVDIPVADVTNARSLHTLCYNTGKPSLGPVTSITERLEPHECRLYFASDEAPITTMPQRLWQWWTE